LDCAAALGVHWSLQNHYHKAYRTKSRILKPIRQAEGAFEFTPYGPTYEESAWAVNIQALKFSVLAAPLATFQKKIIALIRAYPGISA